MIDVAALHCRWEVACLMDVAALHCRWGVASLKNIKLIVYNII